jgi:hypothetical protein
VSRPHALIDSGLSPAHAIVVVDGPLRYDGSYTIPPRPSDNPWLFKETGGLIGPPIPPRRNRKAAP